MLAILARVANEAEAMCGTTRQFGRLSSLWSPGIGSGSVTSSAAPAMTPFLSASYSASGSTTGPRDALTRMAERFILPSVAAIDQVVCLGRQAHVQSDEVALRQQLVQARPPRTRAVARLRPTPAWRS